MKGKREKNEGGRRYLSPRNIRLKQNGNYWKIKGYKTEKQKKKEKNCNNTGKMWKKQGPADSTKFLKIICANLMENREL